MDPIPGERSDADLLAAHAAGDRDAFAQLYFRHRRRLRRLAVNLVRDPEDAADALQEAMLSAHRGAATFRQQAAVGSWLHRIVLNACLDRLRHNRTHSTEVLDERMCAVPDRTGRSDTRISVHSALMTLPAEQRSAVEAVDIQGLSVAGAARLLGIAEGTVKSRRARGRRRLADVLRDAAPHPR